MKTIKAKVLELYKEISDEEAKPFANRKFRKEILGGSLVINYVRKTNNQVVLKIYKTEGKRGSEVIINGDSYFVKMLQNIMVIYNEYGRAVSITYSDGYEWIGESFVSEQAIIEEDHLRKEYNDFVLAYKKSRDIKALYSKCIDVIKLLDNTTCICDTYDMISNLVKARNYLYHCLHDNMDDYFSQKLNVVKNLNESLNHYNNQESEVADALDKLTDYQKLVKKFEDKYGDKLAYDDPILKAIREMNIHIDKIGKMTRISQNDWDLLEYYHDEIERLINERKDISTDLVPPNKNFEVNVEMVDLNADKSLDKNNNQKSNKLFKKLTVREKSDYLTFKSFQDYVSLNGLASASVNKTKKHLEKFNKSQKAYEKLIAVDKDNEISEISYNVYDAIKDAKESLEKTEIRTEKNSKESFHDVLRNNYDQSVYLKRQKELKKSASSVAKVRDIINEISDRNFEKMKKNYLKVKKRIIALGAGIFAGVLAMTSAGVGAYKTYQNNLKQNSLIYENDDMAVYGDEDNLIVGVSDVYRGPEAYLEGIGARQHKESVKYEDLLVGIGADIKLPVETEAETENIVETEAETENIVETEVETENIVETETETESIVETETETENIIETETETESIVETEVETENVVETEAETENVVESEAESIKGIVVDELNETVDTNENLKAIEDEKNLLETYKSELQNIENMLPQSDVNIYNVRSIGDVVNVSADANLQNDEYSLILNSEGHHSIYEDNLPRVIGSVIMSNGVSGITAKNMADVQTLLEQGYYVAGYGLLNPYSKDSSNLEGFYEADDVVGLVRK